MSSEGECTRRDRRAGALPLCYFPVPGSGNRHESKINPSEDREIYLPNGKPYFIDEDKGMQKIMLKPKAGDMILFQGGSIWHRVEPVRGHQYRITFGGFMGFSEDEGTMYYWS